MNMNEQTPKTDIRSMTRAELEAFVAGLGQKPFRAAQIFHWLHQRYPADFDGMTNLSKFLRARLTENCTLTQAKILKKQRAGQDDSIKYLLDLGNNTIIESVWMRYAFGHSVCVSAQAGCRMGCAFCASGVGGLFRSLTAGEMLLQVYAAQNGEYRINDCVLKLEGAVPVIPHLFTVFSQTERHFRMRTFRSQGTF